MESEKEFNFPIITKRENKMQNNAINILRSLEIENSKEFIINDDNLQRKLLKSLVFPSKTINATCEMNIDTSTNMNSIILLQGSVIRLRKDYKFANLKYFTKRIEYINI